MAKVSVGEERASVFYVQISQRAKGRTVEQLDRGHITIEDNNGILSVEDVENIIVECFKKGGLTK